MSITGQSEQPISTKSPRGLRAIYGWMIKNAQGRHAWAGLAAFAFAEASFFPIPADIMVVPMMLADRKHVFRLGAWATFWSVAGGVLGYAIGALFWKTAGLWLIHILHLPVHEVELLRLRYSQNAQLIMVQGATPVPYKLVTIASGLAGVSFPLFMLYSTVTRSVRYLVIEALLVYWFGEKAQLILERYLEWAMVAFVVALILGFVALKYL